MWLAFGLQYNTVEDGEEAGEMVGGGGGGMGPVPTVPLLVHPGIGECAGASGWGREGGGVGIVLNNVNASPHESFKHDPFQT